MLTNIKSAEDSLFNLLVPVATAVGCKLELLPEDYYQDFVGGSTHRNRHAFLAFVGQKWEEPSNKAMMAITQRVLWKWQLVVSVKELRSHQGVYGTVEAFCNALLGKTIFQSSIFIQEVAFEKLEESGEIWIVKIEFGYYELINSACTKLPPLPLTP